jgi:hypothetical protein
MDTLDQEILELTQEVNDRFFPGIGKPVEENILTGYLNIFSDVNFNAMGTVYARKLAEKVTLVGGFEENTSSFNISICLLLCSFAYLSVYLSVCLSVCLSFYPFVY